LAGTGYKAAAYHAGSLRKRARNQERFIKDEINIMVATIAFGMGIDKPDVRLLSIMACQMIEGYIEKPARAGRDGLPRALVLLFSFCR